MKKVLLIEDEESLRKAIHDKLEGKDVSFFEAKNGEEGLAMALKEHPDLIILDIILPKMDGFVTLEKLRNDTWGKKAKVVILSNLNDKKYVLDSFRNEVYDYIVKTDVKIDDLILKIKAKLAE